MLAIDSIPTATFADPYWQAASEAALRALEEADHVLVPAEFLPLSPRFAPLEYSWGLEKMKRLAWCCSKDDVDRLAPWLLAKDPKPSAYAWSNEVFVLGGNVKWRSPASAESQRHLAAWLERVERYKRGIPARQANERHVHAPLQLANGASARRRVLVVGASGMGNVGDDLLAGVLTEMLTHAGADVHLSGPDIDPLRVATYDAVVVGGGGLVYASRDGANETQNLANYLKFGLIGRRFGIPVGLIGIGDQDHAGGIARDPLTRRFVRNALAAFDQVTVRDAASAKLLERFGASKPEVGSDLLFHWTARARAAVRPTATQPGRIALIGELFRYRAFAEGFAARDGGALAACVQGGDFDVLVMSRDDVAHAERMQKALRSAGATAAVVDLRGLDVEALVFLFASYAGIVTTRFHGLVLAALTGIPVLALDVPDGKIARLLHELGALDSLLLEEAGDGPVARLAAALDGQLERVPAEGVDQLAKQVDVHRSHLYALTGLDGTLVPRGVSLPTRSTGATAALPLEGDTIPLCWAASSNDTAGFANLGDALSAVMVAGLCGRPVKHVGFETSGTKLVAVGSIGHAIKNGAAVVWGTGVSIRGGVLAQNVPLTRYDIRAVRGKISAQHYRDFGIAVPDVYGDPVWLLPSIINEPVEKKYELGVIPHIRDVAGHHPEAPAHPESLRCVVDRADADSVAVINTWHEPTWEGLLAKVRLIRSCKRIVSQSFHGVVIAEAYGIPVLNFRAQLGVKNGPLRMDLTQPCNTDPRVWEFFAGGRRPFFYMYAQRRDQRSDWSAVMRAIDDLWAPFEYDAAPLVESFPLPLAYDPLRERATSTTHLAELRL